LTHYEVWGEGSSATEPESGDAVRVWYQRLCALNGLDGAWATTIPDEAETLIIQGAVGYVAEERIMEKPATASAARLQEFAPGLKAYARRQAAPASGLGQLPQLDRWDNSHSASNW